MSSSFFATSRKKKQRRCFQISLSEQSWQYPSHQERRGTYWRHFELFRNISRIDQSSWKHLRSTVESHYVWMLPISISSGGWNNNHIPFDFSVALIRWMIWIGPKVFAYFLLRCTVYTLLMDCTKYFFYAYSSTSDTGESHAGNCLRGLQAFF